MKNKYIVWAVIDKNEKIDFNRTSFYKNRDYATSAAEIRNRSVVEEDKPYKIIKAWLIIK